MSARGRSQRGRGSLLETGSLELRRQYPTTMHNADLRQSSWDQHHQTTINTVRLTFHRQTSWDCCYAGSKREMSEWWKMDESGCIGKIDASEGGGSARVLCNRSTFVVGSLHRSSSHYLLHASTFGHKLARLCHVETARQPQPDRVRHARRERLLSAACRG